MANSQYWRIQQLAVRPRQEDPNALLIDDGDMAMILLGLKAFMEVEGVASQSTGSRPIEGDDELSRALRAYEAEGGVVPDNTQEYVANFVQARTLLIRIGEFIDVPITGEGGLLNHAD